MHHLEGAWDNLEPVEDDIDTAERVKEALERDLEAKRRSLNDLKDKEGDLEDRERNHEWPREQERCTKHYVEYNAQVLKKMQADLPAYYDRSCEKACLTATEYAGCGVMEGTMVGEIMQSKDGIYRNAGIDVQCLPPYASFLKTPVKYGAAPEARHEMCERIYASPLQKPKRAHMITKKGMLWKRERLWRRWRQRYFALESGDAVRSAIMRYWREFPGEGVNERAYQGIIVWDAISVEAQSNWYNWDDRTSCFTLKHFYRTFHLCVPDGDDNPATERDDWVNKIKPYILHDALKAIDEE